jgi:hypothetical protein
MDLLNMPYAKKIFILSLLLNSFCHSQKKVHPIGRERDSLLQLNYLDYDYLYLNYRFEFNNSEIICNEDLKMKLERASNYQDSLDIVLYEELRDDFKTYIAFNRILMKWEKIALFLWLTVDECKNISKNLGIDHPYRFYKFLISEDENIAREDLLASSKQKVEKKMNTIFNEDTNKELLNWMFKHNPDRIALQNRLMKSHKH